MKSSTTRRSRGFSLVELIVIIAVIGVIAAIAIPALSAIFNKQVKDSPPASSQEKP